MPCSGFLSVPILTSSSAYALTESFRWKRGLDTKPRHAKRFYLLIAVSTLAAMAINFWGMNPLKALFSASLINGLLAPPLLLLVLRVANNRKIMGDRTNTWPINLLGWATAAVTFAAAVALIATWGK